MSLGCICIASPAFDPHDEVASLDQWPSDAAPRYGRKPILRLLLIAIPSFLAATLPGLCVAGAFAGFLWLFVYGDDPWPPIASFAVAAAFAASWTTFGMMLTRYLQRRPWTQSLSLAQLALVSVIASVAFVAAVLLRQ